MSLELQAYFEEFLTPRRRERLREVLALRTRHIAVVLDNVHQSQNFSAVLRSCEAFGVQDVHIIETFSPFEIAADVAAGTDKWLTLHRYAGPEALTQCVSRLRQQGYRLVVTMPGQGSFTPATLDIESRVAIVIGNESVGVSPEMQVEADGFLEIPMVGFVESFNLSVAAALCLSELTRRLRASSVDWRLSESERQALLFDWVRASVPRADALEKRWRQSQAVSQQADESARLS